MPRLVRDWLWNRLITGEFAVMMLLCWGDGFLS